MAGGNKEEEENVRNLRTLKILHINQIQYIDVLGILTNQLQKDIDENLKNGLVILGNCYLLGVIRYGGFV